MINTDLIRMEMARQKLNQTDICTRTGLSPNTVSAICNGRDTRLSTLETFASALGMTGHQLTRPDESEADNREEPSAVTA